MILDSNTLALGVASTAVPTVIGWLLNRAIKGIDSSVTAINVKVDRLTVSDTQILIELAELRVRVTQLEQRSRP